MTPECIKSGDITPDDRSIFNFVCDELSRSDYRTCHEACAALSAKFPGLLHRRGRFNGGWEHSWLVLRHRPQVLIDPYPWAAASGPQLLTTAGMSPWRFLYIEEAAPSAPHLHPPLTLDELGMITRALEPRASACPKLTEGVRSLLHRLQGLMEMHG